MQYDYTITQIEENGNFYKICDMCGEKCQSNMGIEMRFTVGGRCGSLKKGLCHKCSKKYEKMIGEFFDKFAYNDGTNKQKGED